MLHTPRQECKLVHSRSQLCINNFAPPCIGRAVADIGNEEDGMGIMGLVKAGMRKRVGASQRGGFCSGNKRALAKETRGRYYF